MIKTREFNRIQFKKIEALLLKKTVFKIDLHIHTRYSADGLQSMDQAIMQAKEKNFDIISIADHDSISAYDDIFFNERYLEPDMPVIIPGIEFTVSYPEYEGRCHVLKYFYNSDDPDFRINLDQNKAANWNRVRMWFQRIGENKCLQYFFLKYGIKCSENGYRNFLRSCAVIIPDYPTIMEYIYSLLIKKGVDVWAVYEKVLTENDSDSCEERRLKKQAALTRFYNKYANADIKYNYRKLKPLLAPVGIDDADFPEYVSSGSLSVNEYGQVPIHKLINSGINILAHPDSNKLFCIDNIKEVVQGLELNWRSDTKLNETVYEKAKELNLLLTKGSDKHSDNEEAYNDTGFYDISFDDLHKIVAKISKLVLA